MYYMDKRTNALPCPHYWFVQNRTLAGAEAHSQKCGTGLLPVRITMLIRTKNLPLPNPLIARNARLISQ
jgi:hypothetical protein